MKKQFIAFAVLLCSTLTAFAQSTINKAKMDSLMQTLETHNKMMGNIAIMEGDKILYSRALGYLQIEGKHAANTQTRYRIGSITKMFTATMIFQLIEEKKLTLQTTLSTYFPQLPNASIITIEQLLNHHSGLFNFTDSAGMAFLSKPHSKAEMLQLFSRQKPVFQPGDSVGYSNTNYVLLGYIIESITGKSYQANLKSRIAKKAGLKKTTVGGKINPKKNEAYSYGFDGVNWSIDSETDMSTPGGAGAIVSTASELTQFIQALFGGKLVSKASLEEMKTIKDGFGKGMFQVPFYEHAGFAHNGSIDGFSSSLCYFPDKKLSIALLCNGLAYQMNDIMIGILSICYDKKYEIPVFLPPVQLSKEKLKRYEGTYASKDFPLKISITSDGKNLIGQATGQGRFILTTINEVEFRYDAAGVVLMFSIEADESVKRLLLQQSGMSFSFDKE